MKKINLIFLLIIFFTCVVSIFSAPTSFQFLKISPDAKSSALGKAYVASSDSLVSLFWNPGSLGQLENKQILATYNSWILGMRYFYSSFGSPIFKNSGIGASITYMSFGEQIDTKTDTTFANKGYNISLGYGHLLLTILTIGGSIKYSVENLWSQNLTMISCDAGTKFSLLNNNLNFGLVVANLGLSKVVLPFGTRIGGEYSAILSDKNILNIMVEFDVNNNEKNNLSFGGELEFSKFFFMRVGYSYKLINSDDINNLTFGVGLKISSFSFDFALIPMEFVGNALIFSCRVQLKKPSNKLKF